MRTASFRGGGTSCSRRRKGFWRDSLNWLRGRGGAPLNELLELCDNLGFPPCWRAYFLLRRQKKVAKEKATPGYAVGYANSPALLAGPGGCGTRGCAPQTVLADCPRPRSVARRSARGPKNGARPTITHNKCPSSQAGEKAKIEDCTSSTDASPAPLRGAEQRRRERKKGEDCLRAQPEFRSPRSHRVAQGTGVAGADPGVALATVFWPRKRKYARQQGGNPR